MRRLDIQGLRAVAVLAVVLYHAGVPGLGGGYVGVDVFFVISGYLITGMLRREVAETGRISFAGFYARRARRILPAAALVLLATVVASAFLVTRLRLQSVLRDAEACAVFAGNYRFAAVGTNYLAGETAPSPFQHYWSLGVEEQFYLLWPAIVLLGAFMARRWRPALGVLLAVVTAASFGFGWWLTGHNPPWAFFSLPTRGWELGVGGLVALTGRRWRVAPVLSWLGLAAVVATVVGFDSGAKFPGVLALAPVAGAALVLLAGIEPSRWGAGRLLGQRPLVGIGAVSYGWYLWHWPVLILGPLALGHPLDLAGRLLLAAVSLLLAVLSLRLVENPVRFARVIRVPRRALAVAAALVATSLAVPAAAGRIVPDPIKQHEAAAAVELTRAPAGTTAPTTPDPPDIAALKAGEQDVQSQLDPAAATTAVPSNLTPPLADAYNDMPAPFTDGCDLNYTDVDQHDCTYTHGSPSVLLFGDSHAAQWFPAMQTIAKRDGWQLQSFTKTLCPPVLLPERSPYLGRAYTECDQWRSSVLDRVRAERPSLVILGASRRYGADFGFQMYGPQWDAALAQMVGSLEAAGSKVIVLSPVPDPHGNVPDCLSAHPDDAESCTVSRNAGIDSDGADAERSAVTAAGGSYLDITPWVCGTDRCPVIVGPMLLYRDDNHLTTTYVNWLTPLMDSAVHAVLAGEALPK